MELWVVIITNKPGNITKTNQSAVKFVHGSNVFTCGDPGTDSWPTWRFNLVRFLWMFQHQKHGFNTRKLKNVSIKNCDAKKKKYQTTIHVQITNMFSWLHGVFYRINT